MPCIGLAAAGEAWGRPAKSKKMVTIQKLERPAAPVQCTPEPYGALPSPTHALQKGAARPKPSLQAKDVRIRFAL